MSDERRYDDDEVATILELATTEHGRRPELGSTSGLTLSELGAIGAEVGIPRDRIVEAASSLALRSDTAQPEQYLGADRTVSRSVMIDRALTDEEWERVVADLRQTFAAKGKVERHGSLRSWSNGNLQIHLEPSGNGYMVRMFTRKGNVTQFTLIGAMFSVMGLAAGGGALFGMTDDSLAGAALMMGLGASVLIWVRATLPAWARQRARQMESLADRIQRLLNA